MRGDTGMEQAVQRFDWSRTPLGPMTQWPQSLRTVVRLMLDSRYAMWLAWGPDLTFFCNDAYRPTLGVKQDFIGAPASRVWSEIWPDIGPRIDHVLNTAEATWDKGLLLYLERSGFKEETYHTFSYSPVHGDSGLVEGMLCVVTEDTERALSERRLSALAQLSSAAMAAHTVADACEASLAALSPSDIPFGLIYLNGALPGPLPGASDAGPGGARLVASIGLDGLAGGAVPSQLPLAADAAGAGRQWLDAAAWPGLLPAQCRLWAEPVTGALLLPLQRHGQDERPAGWLIAGLSPRLPRDAAYERFLELVATQVSNAIADAQAFEAERTRARQLAELDRAKTTFFSNVSHELRTPLTLIASPVDELLSSETDPARRQLLELTQRNAQRLHKLVNSLLEFARIEAGRVQARLEPVELAGLTRDIASTFRSAIESAGLQFIVDCRPLGGMAHVDREMWEKVVLNLLSNAFKFTLAGSITLRLMPEGGGALLEVIDTGSGIPAQEMPRLFERFHRVEGVAGRTQEGSGIGLALVQELVRLHGGSVEADSQAGQGSSFRVRLPLEARHLPADQARRPHPAAGTSATARALVQEALSWTAGALPHADGASAATAVTAGEVPLADRRFAETFGARVLLADDNADMRSYLHGLLAPSYAVEAVADGAQALAAARRITPDVIVSDVMMPNLDGFGLLKALRSDAELRSVPMILLSARAGEEARLEGLGAGVDDYLVKPFSARELQARVGAVLERAAQVRERERMLEASDRQKDEFLAMLAHELRNPLAPIRNVGELLSRIAGSDERVKSAVGILQRQINQLTRLVDDLLDVSRITQKRIVLKLRSLQLAEVVSQAVETVEPLRRDKSHRISVASADVLRVRGDPERLVQCVVNVLTNALKYTDAGGDIQVHSSAEDGQAVLRISDNGSGIAPDLLPRVFDLFVQSERTLDRSQGGLGIGLSLVKRLVEMHGGSINASSAGPGQGASFEIRLPLMDGVDTGTDAQHLPQVRPLRLLVVDDNVDAASSLSMILELEGHAVATVNSSADALRYMAREVPDVALLDIGLPQMDGYELARRIRAGGGEMARVRLIALTGYGQVDDRLRALQSGFDDHLAKPVDHALLVSTLARWVA